MTEVDDGNNEDIEQRLRLLHEELNANLTAHFLAAKTALIDSLERQLRERQHLIELAKVGAAELIARAAVVRAFNFKTQDLTSWNSQTPEVTFRLEVNHYSVSSESRPEPGMKSNADYRVLLLILPTE